MTLTARSTATETWGEASVRLPRATDWLNDCFDRGMHVGVQLAVTHAGTVICGSQGAATTTEPMRDDTLILPLCGSLPMVAAAAVRAMDAGLMGPSDPLHRFLPEAAGTSLGEVTVQAALSHAVTGVDLTSQPPVEEYLRPLDDARQLVLDRVRRRPVRAGEDAVYTTWPFILVASALERVFESPLQELMRREVFEPLGMMDTWMGMPDDVVDRYREEGRLSDLFDCNGSGPELVTMWGIEGVAPGWALPTQGLRAPAVDIAAFYTGLLAARRGQDSSWLSLPAAWAMTTRHRVGIPEQGADAMIDFGLGVELESRHYDKRWISFGPTCSLSTFGHKGMSCFMSFCDPDADLVVVVYLNGQIQGMAHGRRVFLLAQKIYEDLQLS